MLTALLAGTVFPWGLGCGGTVVGPAPPPPPRIAGLGKGDSASEPVVLKSSPPCVQATAVCFRSGCRSNVRNDCSRPLFCTFGVRMDCAGAQRVVGESVQRKIAPAETWMLQADLTCGEERATARWEGAVQCVAE